MIALTTGRNHKPSIPWLLIAALVSAAALGGFIWHAKKQKHDAAMAYCGADAYHAWRTPFIAAVQEFDRAADAALLSPRATLAPLVLRMNEAKAKADALAPVPCAADGAKVVMQALASQLGVFRLFALDRGGEAGAAKSFQQSQADEGRGMGLVEAATAKVVR